MHTYTYVLVALLEQVRMMRTTLNIEDELLDHASQLTGVKEKTALVRMGLEALIALRISERLAKLGGTEKALTAAPRRRN